MPSNALLNVRPLFVVHYVLSNEGVLTRVALSNGKYVQEMHLFAG